MSSKARSTTITFRGEVHIPPQNAPSDDEWADPIKDDISADLDAACELISATLSAKYHLTTQVTASVE